MEFFSPIIIFFVGLVVSIMGTLIGGSSLFTIPTLILLGLPPHSAIGTDRFGIMGVCSAGWIKFHQKRLINYKVGLTLAVPVFFGAIIGANLVFAVGESILKLIIIVVSLFSLVFLIAEPTRGIQSAVRHMGTFEYVVGGAMTFVVGIYVGFYGAMGGTLLLYILVLWFGQTFLESAGTLKIAALVMNAMAAVVFALKGAVAYQLALPMFCGCFIGSYIGAHYADKIGNVWIKRLFLVLLFCLILKLIV